MTAHCIDCEPAILPHLNPSDRQLLAAASSSLSMRDPYTARHSARVARYAVRVAQEIGLNNQDCARIFLSARLHDIGKLAFDDVLFTGCHHRLTPSQLGQVRHHPVNGADYMRAAGYRGSAVAFVLCHHERLDGTGYPRGIKGDRIPIGAQVISIADCFDALTSDRPYQKRREPEKALDVLRTCGGRLYNTDLVEVLAGNVTLHPSNWAAFRPELCDGNG